MLTLQSILPHMIHVGALFYLVCFLFRDQIWLRTFAIFGDLAYTAFYFGLPGDTQWSAMSYSTLNMLVNCYMIVLVINDRRTGKLGDNDMRLYQSFSGMSPGDFRRLSKLGTWQQVENSSTITEEGKHPDHLFFILDGEVDIAKAGRSFTAPSNIFVGEIAFLTKAPASATVTLKPGALYVAWPFDALRSLAEKHDSLQHSLASLLSTDMAAKVARS